MADWFNIVDAQVDPDAPLTSELAYAWRDNVIAAMQGAVGAPRLARKIVSVGGSTGTTSTLIFNYSPGYNGFIARISNISPSSSPDDLTVTMQASVGGGSWSPSVTIAPTGTTPRRSPIFLSFDFSAGSYFSSTGGSFSSGVMSSYPSGANMIRVSLSSPAGSVSMLSSALVEYTGGHAP